MSSLLHRAGDDELLMVLMDAPTRWLVRNGSNAVPVSSLRQALNLAQKCSAGGVFLGSILKQPNDEMVVESIQITRLWEQLNQLDVKKLAAA